MAWHNTKDPLRQRAYLLKQIQQLSWWPGRVVHRAIQRFVLPEIQEGRWPEEDRVISQAQDLARQQLSFSQTGRYRAMSKTDAGDAYCILAPHYFGEQIDPAAFDRTVAIIAEALYNLLSSQQMKNFLMGRHLYRWECRLSFKVEDTTVRAVPDLLLSSSQGLGLDVVDWKVATAASSYHSQVATYALAVLETPWLADHAQGGITGYVVNLLEAEPAVALEDPYAVDKRILTETTDIIYESIERIRALTDDKRYNQLEIGRFEYANSAGTCALCNWRELCMELGDGSPAESLPNIKSEPTQLKLPFG
jgi:hypothetical protein